MKKSLQDFRVSREKRQILPGMLTAVMLIWAMVAWGQTTHTTLVTSSNSSYNVRTELGAGAQVTKIECWGGGGSGAANVCSLTGKRKDWKGGAGGGGGYRSGLPASADSFYAGGAGGVGFGCNITGETLYFGAGGGGGVGFFGVAEGVTLIDGFARHLFATDCAVGHCFVAGGGGAGGSACILAGYHITPMFMNTCRKEIFRLC